MKQTLQKWKSAARQALLVVLIFLFMAGVVALVIAKIYYLIKMWTE